jgi:regulator of protease activity HflC (stomatin/prohibitin superfamily)
MSDDPARTGEPESVDPSEPEPAAAPYHQITEVTATPIDAGDVIERRDGLGRVPVVVRIRRQPPIKGEWVLIAIGLGASGVLLPLFLALKAIIIVLAVVALLVGFLSRIFLRVPPGTVGLTVKSGKPSSVLHEGVHRVSPIIALTHLVTTREIAFDVPVNEVRSSDGVAVSIDLMLTLKVTDPTVFAYQVATGDADALVHAATQDAVRSTLRGIESLATLDLGPEDAAAIRSAIDGTLARYGITVHALSFTRVTLPEAFTASLEARRLAAVHLAEAAQEFALEQRRLADRVALVEQEAEARRVSVELDAMAEALRLAKLEERITANPAAARYDLELARLRVAERLAGNSRAIVSMGAGDLVPEILAREAAGEETAPVAVAATATEAPADGSTPAT